MTHPPSSIILCTHIPYTTLPWLINNKHLTSSYTINPSNLLRIKQIELEKADLERESNELAAQLGSSQRELAIARGALGTSTAYGKELSQVIFVDIFSIF